VLRLLFGQYTHGFTIKIKKLRRLCTAVFLSTSVIIWPILITYSVPVHANDVCTVSPILVNSCRPWLGAYTAGYPNVSNGALGQVQNHEARIDRNLDVVHTAYKTGAAQLTTEETTLAEQPNTSIFINYRPTTTANAWPESDGVANGGEASVDNNIAKLANSIKSVAPNKVFLSIWHEPNGDVSPGIVTSSTPSPGTSTPACPNGVGLKGDDGSPAQYIAMWQNVENIFQQQGATNVVWVLLYENYSPLNCLTTLLYPGNNLVNWVGYDTYNQGLTGAEGTSTAPFEGTAGAFYNLLQQDSNSTTDFVSKPWAIGEFGSCSATFSQSQIDSYFADTDYSLDNNLYPNLKLYMVFDGPGSGDPGPGGCQVGYTPTGVLDPATQAAYNVFADDPRFTDAFYNVPPTVPTGLTATAVSGTQVNLAWNASTDNVGVTGYDVYRNRSLIATTTSTGYSDTNLNGSTTYQYTVTAYDAAGNVSAQSSSASVTIPDTLPPTVPTNLAATVASSGEIDLNWSASTDNVGVSGYNVYRSGNLVGTVTNGVTHYADTGLSASTSYQYTVSAFDAAGNISAQSQSVMATTLPSATPPDTIPPTVPTGLTATAVSGTQVNLAWNASTDNVGVTGYQIYRNGSLLATVTNGTTYSDTGLTNATAYQYTVTAYDAAGNVSAQTSPVTASTPDTIPPTVPTGLKLVLATKSINLSWIASTDNVGVTGYAIYRNGTKIATATSLTYSDTTVVQGSTYKYSVAAYDAAGNQSAQTATQSMTFPDTIPPTKPTNLTLTPGLKSIALQWTASTDNVGVAGYYVYRGSSLIATVTSTTYTATGLVSGDKYSFHVIAFDAAGNLSLASNTVTATAE